MDIQQVTLADKIYTGLFALTGGLTLITKPVTWGILPIDMLGIELFAAADFTLSWSGSGDGILIPAGTVRAVNIRALLKKNVTTIPAIYVSGTGNLNLLLHAREGVYQDME